MPASPGRTRRRPEAPLSEQAYHLIRERILGGALPPGSVLSRRRLAVEFGMSFLPISEALQRLEAEGLVESRPRVGTRVRTPTPEEVRGRYVVREALEAQSAILCCERATFEQRLELKAMAKQLDALYAKFALGEQATEFLQIVHTQHLNLHVRIAEHAGCPELKRAIEMSHVLVYNWFYDVTAERRALPERFHADLVEAIAGGDPAAAERAMRQHVRYGLDGIIAVVAPPAQRPGDWRLRLKR